MRENEGKVSFAKQVLESRNTQPRPKTVLIEGNNLAALINAIVFIKAGYHVTLVKSDEPEASERISSSIMPGTAFVLKKTGLWDDFNRELSRVGNIKLATYRVHAGPNVKEIPVAGFIQKADKEFAETLGSIKVDYIPAMRPDTALETVKSVLKKMIVVSRNCNQIEGRVISAEMAEDGKQKVKFQKVSSTNGYYGEQTSKFDVVITTSDTGKVAELLGNKRESVAGSAIEWRESEIVIPRERAGAFVGGDRNFAHSLPKQNPNKFVGLIPVEDRGDGIVVWATSYGYANKEDLRSHLGDVFRSLECGDITVDDNNINTYKSESYRAQQITDIGHVYKMGISAAWHTNMFGSTEIVGELLEAYTLASQLERGSGPQENFAAMDKVRSTMINHSMYSQAGMTGVKPAEPPYEGFELTGASLWKAAATPETRAYIASLSEARQMAA